MADVANQVLRTAQDAQVRAAEAEVFDGYDDKTGAPIVMEGARPAVSLETVGDRPVVYTGSDVKGDTKKPGKIDLLGVTKDLGEGIVETPAALVSGATKAVNEAVDLIDGMGDALQRTIPLPGVQITDENGKFDPKLLGPADMTARTEAEQFVGDVPNVAPPIDSNTGRFVEGIGQFLTGFAAGGKMLNGVKAAGAVAQGVKAAAQGAISDFAFFDGQAENLSKMIQGTALANPVTEFLATDEETPDLVGRLKHAAEGVGLGALTDAFVSTVRALHAARRAKPAAAAADPLEAQATVAREQFREAAGDPEADHFRSLEDDKLGAAGEELKQAAELQGMGITDASRERVGLNMARVETPDDIEEVIVRTEDMNQDALARAVGYRSWADADAASGGLDGYRLLMERQAGRGFSDVEALAARKTDLAAFGAVRQAARVYQASPTPATAAALRETWVKAYAIHKELIGARAEAARALAVWRMTVDQADAKAAFQQMDRLFSSGGKETADEIAKRVMTIDMVKDPEAATRFLEKSALARGRDMVAEAYQGSLLSSPKTQVVNMVGNTANLAYAIMERAAAGRLSQFLNAQDSVDVAEGAAMAYGAGQGFRDAFRYVFKTMKANADIGLAKATGNATEVERALESKAAVRGDLLRMQGRRDENFEPAITARNAGVQDVPVISQAVDGLGAMVRVFGNAMAFQDDLFKLVNHRAELHAQAVRRAGQEVREGTLPREEMGRRVSEMVDNPTEEMTFAARQAAEDRTFTGAPGKGARIAMNTRRWLNEATPVPVGTMLLPFVNTPANIMGYTFRRTPLAPLFKRYRDAVEAGGAEADLANTQMAMGTMTALMMADYAMSGQVTGAEPTEPSQRELWRRSGIQPYSVKVGDKWVAYNRVEPVGTIMSLGADLAQLFTETPWESDDERQADVDEAVAASGGAIGSMILNKTYLGGVGGLVEYFSDPQRYGEGWLSDLVTPMAAPNIVRDVERIQDPNLREAANVIDRVKARWPGASESLPEKVDLWGRPIMQTSDGGPVYDAFVPIPIRSQDQAPIDKELLRLQADVGMPSKQISIEGIDVGLRNRPDIYNDLVRTAAQEVRIPKYYDMTMYEYLNALVSGKIEDSELYNQKLDSRGVTDRDDDEKTDVIHKVMRDYRDEARDIIKRRYARDLQAMADRKRRSLATAPR